MDLEKMAPAGGRGGGVRTIPIQKYEDTKGQKTAQHMYHASQIADFLSVPLARSLWARVTLLSIVHKNKWNTNLVPIDSTIHFLAKLDYLCIKSNPWLSQIVETCISWYPRMCMTHYLWNGREGKRSNRLSKFSTIQLNELVYRCSGSARLSALTTHRRQPLI